MHISSIKHAELTQEEIDGCGGTRFPAAGRGSASMEQMRGDVLANGRTFSSAAVQALTLCFGVTSM
jgi:hypothetical protein